MTPCQRKRGACVRVGAQGTSVEPLVGTGSLDSQFEAFQQVVALHPTMWDPSVCTKAAFAKGINWVRQTKIYHVNQNKMYFSAQVK